MSRYNSSTSWINHPDKLSRWTAWDRTKQESQGQSHTNVTLLQISLNFIYSRTLRLTPPSIVFGPSCLYQPGSRNLHLWGAPTEWISIALWWQNNRKHECDGRQKYSFILGEVAPIIHWIRFWLRFRTDLDAAVKSKTSLLESNTDWTACSPVTIPTELPQLTLRRRNTWTYVRHRTDKFYFNITAVQLYLTVSHRWMIENNKVDVKKTWK